jgi:hypothetical protein
VAGRRPPLKPKRRREGLIIHELPDEVLIYDPETNRAVCLGPRLASIWRCCTGHRTVAQIARAVEGDAGGLPEDVVQLGLYRIGKARLLEERVPAPAGRSRRELLLRAAALGGLSVLAITAPTALEAATCLTTGTCVNNQCKDPSGRVCCNGCTGAGRTCGAGPGMTFVCN